MASLAATRLRTDDENAARGREDAPRAGEAPWQRPLRLLAFGGLPLLLLSALLALSIHHHFAFDFHQFWQGGRDVGHGRSPYPDPNTLPSAAEGRRLDPVQIQHVFRFPYPAATAVLLAPLGLLPFWAAATIFTALIVAATLLALWILGVRDWRCYGITFASMTVLGAIRLGTLTPLLILLLAIAWRYRDRRWVAALALAGAIVLKLLLWPVLVWLVVTRRLRTAASTVIFSAVALVGGWAAIGFDGFGDYRRLLSSLTASVQTKGYSVIALGSRLGISVSTARVAELVLGALLLALAVVLARRDDGDRLAFTATICASLVLSPIVWLHYFALLVVVIALVRPRLTRLWFVPLLFWLSPFQETDGHLARFLVALVAAGIVFVVALRPTTSFRLRRRRFSTARAAVR